jgi:hypothetical protein
MSVQTRFMTASGKVSHLDKKLKVADNIQDR